VIRRHELPNLLVLCTAIAVGAAAFLAIGRMAGALYGGAALVLGLIVHYKLVRGQQARPDEPDESRPESAAVTEPAPADRRHRRRPSLALTGKRRRALEAELARAHAELVQREAAVTTLVQRLQEQHERTRELQAGFAERITEVTGDAEAARAELALVLEAHGERVALLEATLAQAREELGERDALVGELRRELDSRRTAEQALADELRALEAAQRDEQARLAWSWRAHVEEIAALESAVDGVLRST
jgi:hypothetical protein